MKHFTYLQIAGLIIRVTSQNLPNLDRRSDWRYQNFVLKKTPKKFDFEFNLKVRDNYIDYNSKILFQTEREQPKSSKPDLSSGRREQELFQKDGEGAGKQREQKEQYLGKDIDWRISRHKERFLIEGGTSGNFQVFFDNKFQRIDIFIVNQDNQWKLAELFVGFLQIFLIYYLANKGDGLVVHSAAIKDRQKKDKGYLFAGISQAGKTTTSRIWHKHAKDAQILNDDRIIIRKEKGKFYLYSTPWHGDFSDYLKDPIKRAEIGKLFFICHSKKNKAEKVLPREFFNLFFQSLFLPFWDKEGLKKEFNFIMDLILSVPCYKFGFKNDKKIINYIRRIKE